MLTKPKDTLLAVFSDPHCGSSSGLMRPHREYQFQSGARKASHAQEIIWSRFVEYAEGIKAERKKRRAIVVLAGDLVDGNHHNTLELVTGDEEEQARLFIDCAQYFLKEIGFNQNKGDTLLVINGTEPTHGRAATTHHIAEYLEARPYFPGETLDDFGDPLDDWYPYRRARFTVNGLLMDIAHHPAAGRGNRQWTNGNQLRSYIRSHQARLDARRQTLPRYFVRAHRHTPWHEPVRFDNGTAEGIMTHAILLPSFQFKTSFPYRLGIDESPALGGAWIKVDGDGQTDHKLDYLEITQKEDEVFEL